MANEEASLATKVITEENWWGDRGGNDGELLGLGVVRETDGGLGTACRLDVGTFCHNEAWCDGQEGEVSFLSNMEGEGRHFTTRIDNGSEGVAIDDDGGTGEAPTGERCGGLLD